MKKDRRHNLFVSAISLGLLAMIGGFASCGGGGGTTANNTPTSNPTPAVSSLSPSSLAAGSTGQTLTINGTGFVSGSTVTVNSVAVNATFVSSTQLTIPLTTAQLSAVASLAIVVTNPSPGGGASNSMNLSVTGNPVPAISSLSPTSLAAGSAAQTLTITGTGFISSSAVSVNAAPATTTYVSATQLTIHLTTAQLAAVTTLAIVVTNPSPGGGASNSVNFDVTGNPVPAISTLSPTTLAAGSAAHTLTITGTNFISGSVVKVNSVAATTTYVSATELTIQLTTVQLAAAATLAIQVTNPSPGGGVSNSINFSVTGNPAPTISSLSPTTLAAGSAAHTLTINGTNFISGSVVKVNSVAATTTYVSATELTIQLTTVQLAAAATLTIQVTNPSPGGGTSSSVDFNVTNPVPTVSSLSPASLAAGSAAQVLTINGTNFVSTSTVTFNGVGIAAAFVTAEKLTIQLTTGDLSTPGSYAVVVKNAAPGGGSSSSVNFSVTAPAITCPSSGNESILHGQYAFFLSGYNSGSTSGFLGVAGSFTADGSGGITAGEVDSNGALGVQTASSISTSSSAYAVGADGRGCLTLKTSFYTFTTRIALRPDTGTANAGFLEEWESGVSPYIAAGQIFAQTAGATPSGTYVALANGTYGGNSLMATAGAFHLSAGAITGEYDSNTAGVIDGGGAGPGAITSGSYGTTLDADGRTTSTVTSSAGTLHQADYFVSNSQYLTITTDAPGATTALLVGQASAQTAVSGLTVGKTFAVFQSGVNGGGTGGEAQVGLVTINTSSALSGTTYSWTDGAYQTPSPLSCTYAVDGSGRMLLSGTNCGSKPPILYVSGTSSAVILGTDSGVATGQSLLQTATSITAGTYIFGNSAVPSQYVESALGWATITSAGSLTAGTSDFTALGDLQQADQPNAGATFTANPDGTFTIPGAYPAGDVGGVIVSPSLILQVNSGTEPNPSILLIVGPNAEP